MKITETDAITGETIEREATAEEIAQLEEAQQDFAGIESIKAEKDIAKTALLEKLGITEDEAKLLLG